MAHAYLFMGPEGIGKAALALKFAQALECEQTDAGYRDGRQDQDDACGTCDSCRKIIDRSYPDLLQIGSESESGQVKIDQVRQLERFMSLTPFAGRWKVGLLDGADRLTEEGTHACLKMLEEPPDHSVFLLLTTRPYRLPATLVSRCHWIRCSPQGVERVAAWLARQEKMEEGPARMLAMASGGRLGVALQLAKSDRLARKNLLLDQLLSAAQRGELDLSLPKMTREEIADGLEWVAGWWRDLVLLSLGGNPDWVLHQDRLPELQKGANPVRGPGLILAPLAIDQLLDQIDRIYQVQDAIQKNANTKTALSFLLARNG